MAYTPTEWATGDVITAVKLNNMEQGIEDAFVAPTVTIADEGDVLTVNSSGAWAAAAPASQLPSVTAADQGKVLTVDSSGDWAAAAPASPVIIPVSQEQTIATLAASYAELVAAKNSMIIAQTDTLDDPEHSGLGRLYLVKLSETGGTYSAVFGTIMMTPPNTAAVYAMTFTASSADADMTYTNVG